VHEAKKWEGSHESMMHNIFSATGQIIILGQSRPSRSDKKLKGVGSVENNEKARMK
jgi:hypothetical protein